MRETKSLRLVERCSKRRLGVGYTADGPASSPSKSTVGCVKRLRSEWADQIYEDLPSSVPRRP